VQFLIRGITLDNCENPMTDIELDYWAGVYTACRLTETGLRFEDFVTTSPWEHLERLGQLSAPACLAAGVEPLLPAQAAVARRLGSLELAGNDLTYDFHLPITSRQIRSFLGNRLQDILWNTLPWPVGLAIGAILVVAIGATLLVSRSRRGKAAAQPISDEDP
jgi:hypothetical protein